MYSSFPMLAPMTVGSEDEVSRTIIPSEVEIRGTSEKMTTREGSNKEEILSDVSIDACTETHRDNHDETSITPTTNQSTNLQPAEEGVSIEGILCTENQSTSSVDNSCSTEGNVLLTKATSNLNKRTRAERSPESQSRDFQKTKDNDSVKDSLSTEKESTSSRGNKTSSTKENVSSSMAIRNSNKRTPVGGSTVSQCTDHHQAEEDVSTKESLCAEKQSTNIIDNTCSTEENISSAKATRNSNKRTHTERSTGSQSTGVQQTEDVSIKDNLSAGKQSISSSNKTSSAEENISSSKAARNLDKRTRSRRCSRRSASRSKQKNKMFGHSPRVLKNEAASESESSTSRVQTSTSSTTSSHDRTNSATNSHVGPIIPSTNEPVAIARVKTPPVPVHTIGAATLAPPQQSSIHSNTPLPTHAAIELLSHQLNLVGQAHPTPSIPAISPYAVSFGDPHLYARSLSAVSGISLGEMSGTAHAMPTPTPSFNIGATVPANTGQGYGLMPNVRRSIPPPPSSGRRSIQLRLVEDVHQNTLKSKFPTFRRKNEEPRFAASKEDNRGTIVVSWYEGTTTVELQDHVMNSVSRKLEKEVVDLRLLDENVIPHEEVVLTPYIPDGSKFLVKFTLAPPVKTVYNYTSKAPESPSRAPTPTPSIQDIPTLNLGPVANRSDKQASDVTNKSKQEKKHTVISKKIPTKFEVMSPKTRQNIVIKPVTRSQEKKHVIFVLANYFVLFLSAIAISAEIHERGPHWVDWLEHRIGQVNACAVDRDSLFECVSDGDFSGILASFFLWLTSKATRRFFLFGFDSVQKLWTAVYEALVTALCWGTSYMFIRRGLNPDTRPNFLERYWKDCAYGSLAGFNAAFMKAVMKNLIPQEVLEDVIDNQQLKIVDWLKDYW